MYFKHGIHSPFFPLQNAVCFIILTFLVPVLFAFYIQSVLKLKNNSGAKRLTSSSHKRLSIPRVFSFFFVRLYSPTPCMLLDLIPATLPTNQILLDLIILIISHKGKAVPLQTWTGPEGSRKLRFPDFVTTVQDGGKVVSLTHRPPLPPGNSPGTHLC